MARLVREVADANPRTVLVVMSSYPYLMPDEAPAVVWTSHAGQETGRAIASLLSGEHEFEGRLPQAWPACDADLPDALDYDIITAGWTYQYATAAPRFPFGHGLTYTTFGYGELTVALAGDAVTATLDVTNTGDRAGSEVVQLYASYPGTAQPRRRLIGFSRVALEPGETGTATIGVPVSRLELWDVAAGRMALPAGPLEILAGASSGDIRQAAMLPLPAAAAPLRAARVAAADFDDQVNVTLIDTTRSSGTSITPADPARAAWVRYDRLDSVAARGACLPCRLRAAGRRADRGVADGTRGRRFAGNQRSGAVHRRTLLVESCRRAGSRSRARRSGVPGPARPGATGLVPAVSLWFGGDYNPEQWDAATWACDDALMRQAQVNTVTVGAFSWAMLEPAAGSFSFDWLDATLGRLHGNGIRVVLATPTASPPPWFTLAHPDAMPVRPDGSRLWHGSRDTYCAAAPAYREAALRIASELGKRYASRRRWRCGTCTTSTARCAGATTRRPPSAPGCGRVTRHSTHSTTRGVPPSGASGTPPGSR